MNHSATIDDTLYDAFGHGKSHPLTQRNHITSFWIDVWLSENPLKLQDIYVSSPTGSVPLSTFTHVESGTGPLSINRQGQFPVVTISFNLAPDVSLGEAIKAIEKIQKDTGMPASIQPSFQGTALAFEASLTNEPLLILAAVLTVYIVSASLTRATFTPHSSLNTAAPASVRFSQLLLFRLE